MCSSSSSTTEKRQSPLTDGIVYPLTLTVPARLEAIEAICDAVDAAALAAGFDERDRYACQLAAGEACENIVKHGYSDRSSGDIEVRLQAAAHDLTIELLDSAPPFNPASLPYSALWSVEDPPIGGLGLVIIHRVMDEVRYERRDDKNRLTMRKHGAKPART
jgi:anti-sigma regulatory factor (Ser/Thr protein kinase)